MRKISVVLLLSAIALAIPNNVNADWWSNGNFYQIYPRSFMDSDADGVGDLNGVASRLEYFREIGMDGVWLSPIFKSPMADFGYDISDFNQIHEEFGSMEDFDRLAAKCRRLGIKLILDFVPNHTSDEHEWFQKSVAKDPEYKDYYIWHPGKILANGTRVEPSNWISVFQGRAWQWNEKRQEYYLHQFLVKQPDLNYRNPKVVQAMKDVLTFWLHRGVSGFRIDAVPYLFEANVGNNGSYPDEPLSGTCNLPDDPCYLKHIYTQNLDETFDMSFQWRAVLDDFQKKYGGETRILMIEAYTSLPNSIRLYGNETVPGAQIPFNFELISYLNLNSTAKDYEYRINSWLNSMPKGNYSANWVLGNHDNNRIAKRFGEGKIDLINILLQTLPGVAVTYYGEEIGMKDVWISWEDTVDPAGCNVGKENYERTSRDPARTPFQWSSNLNAGFSKANKTWLPVASNWRTDNADIQRSIPYSHLKNFKKLTKLRKTPTFIHGNIQLKALNNNTLAYVRELPNVQTFVVVLNVAKVPQTVNLSPAFPSLSRNLEVVVASLQSRYVAGDLVTSNSVEVDAESGLVLAAF